MNASTSHKGGSLLRRLLLLASLAAIVSVLIWTAHTVLTAEYNKKPLVNPPRWSRAKYQSPKNPYLHYQKAIALLPARDEQILENLAPESSSGRRAQVTKQQAEQALTNVQPALAELRKGAALLRKDFEFAYKPASFTALSPELSRVRKLARVAVVDARAKIDRGQTRQGLEELVAIADLGNDCTTGPNLIHALVGMALKEMAFQPLHHYIGKPMLKASDYRLLAKQLERIDRDSLPLQRVMENEYVFARGSLKSLLSADRQEVSAVLGREYYFYLHLPGRKLSTLRNFDKAWETILDFSDRPYPQAAALDSAKLVPASDRINTMLIQPLSKISQSFAAHAALLRGRLLMAALEGYRQERGQYPASLQDLVAGGYIAKVPHDPFTYGDPFIYARKPNGYLLYSIGPDMSDEGGSVVRPYNLISASHRGDIVFAPGLEIWRR